ncbi:AAA family ATPase [Streptococcus merionis]|uniref:Predicted kinase n=1 Tax=Streptococcus merionis TaxID=400065 RepID=A0A239SUU0_9STRE|nr:AAA family ATPase [Streptococcus merionis]SNU89039.1 Predicted kinase [Streptococcus merionis]
MKKYLILLAGPPATGKTYLVNLIREVLPKMYVVSPDEFKEDMAESVGFNSLEEKALLEEKVWFYYYQALNIYMTVGKQFILTEYPFSIKQKGKLKGLAEQHNYEIITIRLTADFETLWNRRRARDLAKDRHLSFIMTHYHYGDVLDNRELADNHISKGDFYNIIEARRYNHFSLGKLYTLDVTDYDKVDYTPLMKALRSLAD